MATKAEAKVRDLLQDQVAKGVGEANDVIVCNAHRQPVHVNRDEH